MDICGASVCVSVCFDTFLLFLVCFIESGVEISAEKKLLNNLAPLCGHVREHENIINHNPIKILNLHR